MPEDRKKQLKKKIQTIENGIFLRWSYLQTFK